MGRKALCVEPSPSLRALLSSCLTRRGWDVSVCESLDAVVAALSGNTFELVVTAASLPVGDYADVVRQVRGRVEMAGVPVILLTADGAKEAAQAALESGVTEVFAKSDLGVFEAYLDSLGDEVGLAKVPGGRALVLDDEDSMARYLSEILSGLGMVVDRACSVDDALLRTLSTNYDLVLVDIVLGSGQSGNQFVRSLRQSPGQARHTPVIAISGYQDSARRLDALRSGANVYLSKPVSEAEVSFHAQKLLAREPVLSPAEQIAETGSGRVFDLSKRESAICGLVVTGLSDKKVAERLGISYWTVRSHMASIFRKCGVVNRVELVNLLRNSSAPQALEEAHPEAGEVDWLALSSHVLDGFQYGVMVTDRNQRILHVNQAFTRITGYAAEEIVGQTPRVLHSGKHDSGFYHSMFKTLEKAGVWQGEIWNRHKDGRLFLEWLEIRTLGKGAPQGAHYVAVISDVTEHRLEVERIRHSALHDSLTGLANRGLLLDQGEKEIARAKRFGGSVGVVFIDLDRFKTVNDTLGHEVGDQLLRELGRRIQAKFRENDTLARFGGDEFVAVMPDFNGREAALALAQKVLQVVSEPITLKGLEYRIGASIGISVYPGDGQSVAELIARADNAMYRAKEAGGNLVRFYDREMDDSVGHLLAVENRLYEALRLGEFVLHFQPKVDFGTLAINGAEALLRWYHPERGLVSPAEFIPVAERSSLIIDLGNWILREACRSLKHIQEAGYPDFSMAINVSPLQVVRHDFVSEVADALATSGIPPQSLQLEITEAVFIKDPERALEILNRLVALGVTLALDDFGTGYSSLGYLKSLPFDTIKVDREFIRNVHDDRYNGSLAAATIHMANGLDMKVVAEGVENWEQFAHLEKLGCHVAQGFMFGRPMVESELLGVLRKGALLREGLGGGAPVEADA